MCPSYDSSQINLDAGEVSASWLVQGSESSFERSDTPCQKHLTAQGVGVRQQPM